MKSFNPGLKAAYLLLLEAVKPFRRKVGSLGTLSFQAGYYVYVGSALGPGGVEARVKRHRRLAEKEKLKLKWHIDYLLSAEPVRLKAVWAVETGKPLECELSRRVKKISAGFIQGFGASDCREGCPSHLYFFKENPESSLLSLLEEFKVKKIYG